MSIFIERSGAKPQWKIAVSAQLCLVALLLFSEHTIAQEKSVGSGPAGAPAQRLPAPRPGLPPPLPPAPVTPTTAGIAYATAEPADSQGHFLDLFVPKAAGPLPIVIWTGGSGWMAENGRVTAGWIAQQLNPAGYAVVGVSVRSSSKTHFPGQLQDMKSAIRWLRAHAKEHNLDAQRIAVMGDSSGGWNAAITALTGDDPNMEGSIGTTGPSSAVKAAVAFYPPTDFLHMDEYMIGPCSDKTNTDKKLCHDSPDSPESRLIGCAIQGCPDAVERANPIRYISKAAPPMLILHGEVDQLVPFNQGERLYEALSSACHDVTFIVFPKSGHGTFVGMFNDDTIREGATVRSTGADCKASSAMPIKPTWQTLIAFLDRTVKIPRR